MKKIKYTPDAADKLRLLNKAITEVYGKNHARKILKIITMTIRGLAMNEKQGVSVKAMFEIESEYRYLYVMRNYVFYRIENNCIQIINIYNEREDFMWQLFGIDTTPYETNTYWDE